MLNSIPWLLNAFVLCSLTRSLTEVLCFAAGSSLNTPSSSQLKLHLESPLRSSSYPPKSFVPYKNVRSWKIRGGQLPDEPNGFELSSSSDSTTVEEFENNVESEFEAIGVNGQDGNFTASVEHEPAVIPLEDIEHANTAEKIIDPTVMTEQSNVKQEQLQSSTTEIHGESIIQKEEYTESTIGRWPCGDELDKKLIKIALPCIANFAINPLVGAVDLFWINRMKNTLAVAGQAAANQIFTSSFWLFSFLPSGKSPV